MKLNLSYRVPSCISADEMHCSVSLVSQVLYGRILHPAKLLLPTGSALGWSRVGVALFYSRFLSVQHEYLGVNTLGNICAVSYKQGVCCLPGAKNPSVDCAIK